jgi:formate/nitrite transporter FocA (FNT family)
VSTSKSGKRQVHLKKQVMKNRFVKRGVIAFIAGIALNILGYVLKENGNDLYGWAMLIGTILFGVGFLLIFYSIVRKVEYTGIKEERAENADKFGNHKLQPK